MDLIVKSVSQNHYFVLLTGVASLISFIIGVTLPIMQRKKKQLAYSLSTTELVNDKLSKVDGLDVTFKGVGVDQLSVTSVSIVNNGNEIIKKDDFHDDHELKICVSDDKCELIDAKVTKQSSDTVGCEVSIKNNEIFVHFKIFEKKDCVSVNIYHTGSENSEFKIEGKIIAGKIVHSDFGEGRKIPKIVIFTLLLSIIVQLGCISLLFPIPYISDLVKAITTWIMTFLSVIFWGIIIFFVITALISRY